MLFTLGVLFVCLAGGILSLLPAICRYRESSWLASETFVLCVSAPLVMLLGALGIGMLAWVSIHGGLWASLDGPVALTSVLIAGASILLSRLAYSLVRGKRAPSAAPSAAPVASSANLTGTRSPEKAAPAG